jgi:hypothetical protein
LFRVRTFEVGVEIDRRELAVLDLGDQLAHLQAPIAQMHVAEDRPAIGAEQPLQAVADDGRAQMADMHGLGDIGAAEIQHRGLAVSGFGRAETNLLRDRADARGQYSIRHVEIDEAGTGDLDLRENRIGLQARRDLFGDRARIDLRLLGGRQRAVALELREIGPVGALHQAQLGQQSLGGERGARDRRQFLGERDHGVKRPNVRL